MVMSPPRPPSPPLGPPRGTNFSRRNARQPLPPSPAFTRIRTSSMNIEKPPPSNDAGGRWNLCGELLYGEDVGKILRASAIAELDRARHCGEKCAIFAETGLRS